MKTYLVGGAVRDSLLGIEPKDRDYVIVGATPEELDDLVQKGYRWVGKDFPVMIGPDGCEYALARTERKTGVGYYGFDTYSGSDVTLEQDLSRRDLTINAMAMDDNGNIIDPFGGKTDLECKVLRHTSTAFKEDPVRVLRLARFLSRLGSEWYVSHETNWLCWEMNHRGRLKDLVSERVWQEMHKALKEKHSELFFGNLMNTCLFPELTELKSIPQPIEHHPEVWSADHVMLALKQAEILGASPEVKFSVLMHDLGKVIYKETGNLHGHEEFGVAIVEEFCNKWRVPARFKALALHVTKQHGKIHTAMGGGTQGWMKPNKVMSLFEDTAALSHPTRFKNILLACEADSRGRKGFEEREYPIRKYLSECLDAVLGLDTKPLVQELLGKGKKGTEIGEQVRVARIHAVRGVQNKWKYQQ